MLVLHFLHATQRKSLQILNRVLLNRSGKTSFAGAVSCEIIVFGPVDVQCLYPSILLESLYSEEHFSPGDYKVIALKGRRSENI